MNFDYHKLVKEQLLAGAKVTTVSIWQTVHTSEGRKILSDLRKDGLDIIYEWKCEYGKRFKVHYLSGIAA